ncbi:MAG: hypothetical protein R2932_49080 [Caldilineaceae bacterium]
MTTPVDGPEENLLISRSTFHGNRALRQGGAVWLYILGTGQIVNSTFEGNTTTVSTRWGRRCSR